MKTLVALCALVACCVGSGVVSSSWGTHLIGAPGLIGARAYAAPGIVGGVVASNVVSHHAAIAPAVVSRSYGHNLIAPYVAAAAPAVVAAPAPVVAAAPAVVAARTYVAPAPVLAAAPAVVAARTYAAPAPVVAAAPAVVAARTYAAPAPVIAAAPAVVAATSYAAPAPVVAAAPAVVAARTYAAPAPVVAAAPAVVAARTYAAPAPVVAAAPAVIAAPVTKTQWHAQTELGQASYGHSEALQTHSASQDAHGNKVGSFSYVNPHDGQVHRTDYVADALGYRVAANDLPIDTPEVALARSAHLAAHLRARRGLGYAVAGTPYTLASPYNVVAAPAPASALYDATLTTITNNPGHAVSYRID